MGNNDKRLSKLRSAFHQQPHRILTRPRIQISGRLVCKNDAGLCNQCTGDRHTLLLSTGKLCGAGMQLARNAQDFSQLMEHLFIRCSMVQIERDQNIIPHRVLREQAEILKNKADLLPPHLCQLLRIHCINVLTVQQHLTGGGWQKSSQNFQERGFSAAAGSDDGRKCTVFKGQVAISEGVNRTFPFPVGFGDLHSFQNFIFHKMSPLDAFLRIKEKIGSNAADSQNTISRMLTMI